jgi:hypothetical protein
MIKLSFINQLTIVVTLATLFGVVVHDTKVDQFTAHLLAVPAVIATYEGANALKLSDSHVHVEIMSMSQVIRNLNGKMPSLATRMIEDKKYRMPKSVVRGHHAFDNYNLPVLA